MLVDFIAWFARPMAGCSPTDGTNPFGGAVGNLTFPSALWSSPSPKPLKLMDPPP